eukprot:GGOE01041149.1.p2 GENE.GGOE01041149.1~~GGOE01041149.1.p2  ORF type:complete len:163 (-),score=26.80 GGOE01041149.1:176-664(-)
MVFVAREAVWIFKKKPEGVHGAGDFGLFEYTLESSQPDGHWSARPNGFCARDAPHAPAEESIEPQRIVRLVRPEQWAVQLGDAVLAWKVVSGSVGAWWVARVVGAEWKGLYKGEEEHMCIIQWLTAESWERDPAKWETLRPSCLLPLPDCVRPFVQAFLGAV